MTKKRLALLFAGSTILGATLVTAQSTSDLLSMQEKVVAAECGSGGDAQGCDMARKTLEMIKQTQAEETANHASTSAQPDQRSGEQSRFVAAQAVAPTVKKSTGGVCTAMNPSTHEDCIKPGEVTSRNDGTLTYYSVTFTNSCMTGGSVQALASSGVPNDWRSGGIEPGSTAELTCISGPGRKGSCSGFSQYRIHYSSCH